MDKKIIASTIKKSKDVHDFFWNYERGRLPFGWHCLRYYSGIFGGSIKYEYHDKEDYSLDEYYNRTSSPITIYSIDLHAHEIGPNADTAINDLFQKYNK